jgi:hypothetical protein
MDRAYEGDETRQLVLEFGFEPVVPPTPTAATPGPTAETSIAGATRSSACSAGSKASAASLSRFEKLDLMFTAFIHFALIIDMICVNTS